MMAEQKHNKLENKVSLDPNRRPNDDKGDAGSTTSATGEAKEAVLTATFKELFSQAESIDIVLMILGAIGAMGTGISVPIFNILFGKILDALNKDPNGFSNSINSLALDFLYIGIANLVSGLLQVACWTIAGERQAQKFREMYVKSILSQEIGWFDQCGAGELATRVADLTGKVEDGLGRKFGDFLQYTSQVLAAFAIAFYFSWKLTLVLLSAIPLIALAGAFMISAVTAAQAQSLEQYAAAGGLATETLSAIRTISALNAQPDVINRYRAFLYDAMKVGITKGFKVGLGNGGLFCAAFFAYALGFWYGGTLIADDIDSGCVARDSCISGGTILSVFFCVIMGSMGLGQIATPLSSFVSAKAAVRPLYDVIQRKPLIDGLTDQGLKPAEKPRGQISLNDIEFCYPSRPNIQICKGYTLRIEAGETVALVGASGSGKSTIINLLLRFYDPQSGSVKLDDMNIRDLNVRWLRANIGYVGQEPVLFSGSIADNIAYGLDSTLCAEKRILETSTNETEREAAKTSLRNMVIEAAKLSNAHDFISGFPQGYETDVGSNGIAMSGGQKQRIAIARALIKRPAVLLLDEATSALDATSERMVQESIDKLSQSKMQTTVIVAHRLSTIRGADKIAVVSEGLIAEIGKHDELLAKNGLYADLIRLQMSSMGEMAPADEDELVAVAASANNSGASPDGQEIKATKAVSNDALVGKQEIASTAVGGKAAVAKPPPIDKEESKRLNKRVWGLIYEQWPGFLIALGGAACFGGIFPAWGLFLARTQEIFYYSEPERIRNDVAQIAGVYCALAFGSLISATYEFYGIAIVGEKISMSLRSQLFESVVRREIAFFDKEENAVGDLTTRLADDSRIVTKATGETAARQLQAFCTLTLGLALGFSASWKIAFVVLATFPISIIASAVQMQAISGQQYDTSDGGPGHGGIISSAFTHMRTVAAFSVQFRILDEYSLATRKIRDKKISKSYIAGLGFGGSQMAMFCTYALLFWYGSTLIKSDEVTFVQMMTAILTLMLGALGLGTALTDVGDQNAGLQAARRIFKSVEDASFSPIDGLSNQGNRPTERLKGRIELVNVNFSYPSRPDAKVCQDYNLVIEPGEVVALVGPSGSGKSTIMNLLLRFYDPSSGKVMLDGVDIKDLNVRWLRSQIGYVGQEPTLFTGSVADNIAKGRATFGDKQVLALDDCIKQLREGADATGNLSTENKGGDIEVGNLGVDEDIIQAARQSNAHDFISAFPQGYKTDVGEGSIMVSGGQKQRIAIARALIKRPAVLLLDEATSALDAASERLVQDSIDILQQSKMQTTIVIAHRLTTIMNADKIAVIDKGRVVEIGKHDELLAKNGLYATLWNKQSGHQGAN